MRNVVIYELLSLDGVAEHPDQLIFEFDELMRENLGCVIGSQDAVLLGRRTYEDWARFWSGSDIQPFSTFINGVQKYVATSTPLDPSWADATGIAGGLEAFVADLKEQPGGDIRVHGSIAVAQALLEAALVDRLCLVVAPTLQEHGRKLFEGSRPTRLTLTRSITSPSGTLLLDFAPQR